MRARRGCPRPGRVAGAHPSYPARMSGTPSPNDTYTSPLAERNASPEMLRLWSARHKFNTWRRIWLAVAEAQHKVTAQGAPGASPGPVAPLVTREQVEELRAVVNRPGGITDAEIERAKKYERELRHDVMAHVHALGDACPKARPIIHLGMTSQDVVCNADLLILQDALGIIEGKVSNTMVALGLAAEQHKTVPTLAFTHYQAAQPITVGRRFVQGAQDLHQVWFRFFNTYECPRLKGFRGATGTQASYLSLFAADRERVDLFEATALRRLQWRGVDADTSYSEHQEEAREAMPEMRHEMSKVAMPVRMSADEAATSTQMLRAVFERLNTPAGQIASCTLGVTTQTYPRVFDTFILADLASCAAVLHKIATDIRLLCNRKELDEPFEDKQIGSSAMPYKRNPMRCERICGLCRFVMNLVGNAYDTAATQWLERTLDDSSNRRLSLPEAFLALDGALDLMHNVASGLIVHEAMVKKNLMAELPFMATENILMACVKLGGDRQEYHEKIRVHAQAAGMRVKHEGLDNDLIERLKSDRAFWSKARGGPLSAELDWSDAGLLDPMKYIGRSVEQTERFIKEVVEPLRQQYGEAIAKLGESGPRV